MKSTTMSEKRTTRSRTKNAEQENLQTPAAIKKKTTSKKKPLSEVDTNTEDDLIKVSKKLADMDINDSKPRRVKFAEKPQQVEYSKEEPSIKNIGYVTSSEVDYTVRERKESTTGVPVPASPRSAKQIYSLHSLNGVIEGGFETRDMSIGELKKELTRRDLSTSGTKTELRLRLEESLVAEGAEPSPEIDRTLKSRSRRDETWLAESLDFQTGEISLVYDNHVSTSLFSSKPVKTYSRRKN